MNSKSILREITQTQKQKHYIMSQCQYIIFNIIKFIELENGVVFVREARCRRKWEVTTKRVKFQLIDMKKA